MSIAKTRQTNLWHHLLAISCSDQGIGLKGGGVQYTCLVGCRLPPLDGYVSVCLVLTIEVYGNFLATNGPIVKIHRNWWLEFIDISGWGSWCVPKSQTHKISKIKPNVAELSHAY